MSAAERNIAVTGASGQLGSDLVEVLSASGSYRVSAYDRERLDITDRNAVEREIAPGRFFAVINAAALTNVDRCEEAAAEALAVNATGAWLVARACASAGSRNVLIGTDFVFGGEKSGPYYEEDRPAPINVYGTSKLTGESLALLAAGDSLVLRISSVFGKRGSRGKGGNFVESILAKARSGERLRVVDDTVMSPTYTADVARALPALLDADARGVVHLSNSGSCTWYEFARQILDLTGLDAPLEAVTSDAFPRPARRPRNSALASGRTGGLLGRPMRPWREALRAYLLETGHVAAERVDSSERSTASGNEPEGERHGGAGGGEGRSHSEESR
jgi:dTDP-4-dehydrorhamnose reductase